MPLTRGRVMAGVAIAVVAGTVIAGLIVSGSPSEARLYRFDDRRVQDLSQAAGWVNIHWVRGGSLPSSVEQAMSGTPVPVDPATRQPYEYRVTGAKTYELCAVFDRPTLGEPWPPDQGTWRHGTGRQCLPREARKE